MPKIRKAIAAGVSAGLSVLFTGLATEIPRTSAGWLALGTSAVGAALVAGYAVYGIRNELSRLSR